MDWSLTRITHEVNWNSDGRQLAELRLKPSDNARPLGYYPIPVGVLKNGDGPTLLLTGGTHGDEFEGPAALYKLIHHLDIDAMCGRLIVFPALNVPAVMTSSRCSPVDDGNLNRAFPGDPDGTATWQIAHMLEHVVLPECQGAIDLHSGGRASEFVPLAMYNPGDDSVAQKNKRLALAFAPALIWIMGKHNDNRSVNGAAQRQGVPMFATELGGGGNVNPALADLAYEGILRVMEAMGMWSGPTQPAMRTPQFVQTHLGAAARHAPHRGLFVPAVQLGDRVVAGDTMGHIYSIDEIERAPNTVTTSVDGIVMCLTHNGCVERGDLLVQLGLPA